jgi:hypothetical protein
MWMEQPTKDFSNLVYTRVKEPAEPSLTYPMETMKTTAIGPNGSFTCSILNQILLVARQTLP